jgi:hypothetical protein
MSTELIDAVMVNGSLTAEIPPAIAAKRYDPDLFTCRSSKVTSPVALVD